MIEAARLGIYVGAQTEDAKSGLEGVSAMVEKAGAKMTGWGLKMSALVSAPLMAIGKQALGAGSDLAESASKVDVVFGAMSGVVEAFADTSATAFGISEQAALESTGTFGNLFTSMGMGQDAAAAMSVDVVSLAADLASFNNIDSSAALEKLRSGLVGEAEPLRALGINLTEAGVKAQAMAMGLASSTEELTAADLVQARYALILQQSTNAQGDFARTADGLANSQRIMMAQLQDVAATLGQQLLPIVKQVVEGVSELVQRFAALTPETQNLILGMAGVAAATGPTVGVIGSLATAIGALLSPVGLYVAAVAAIAGGALLLITRMREARQVAYEQGAQIVVTATSYGNYLSQMEAAGLKTKVLTEDVYELIQAHRDQVTAVQMAEYTQKIDEWSRALASLKREQDSVIANWLGIYDQQALQDSINMTEGAIRAYATQNEVFEEMAAAAGLLTEADLRLIAADREVVAIKQEMADAVQQAADASATAAEDTIIAADEMANAWQGAMESILNDTEQYKDANQAQIMDYFAQAQGAYVDHAVNIARLESEREQALIDLQVEAQNIRAQLEQSGDAASLAQLAAVVNAKRTGILAYYNGRIQTEKAGQQTIMDIAKVYYLNTLKILTATLRAQLEAQVANIQALVRAVTGGYGAMTQAIAIYNKVKAGADAIAATRAAIAEVNSAFAAIEAAGKAAATAAMAEFDSWSAASSSLNDVLKDLGGTMGDVGSSAGSAGSSVRTAFKDPVEEAARAIKDIGEMISRAMAAFDELAGYRGPRAGWQEAMADLLENVTTLILQTSAAAEALKAAGFYEIEDDKGTGPLSRLLSFVNAVAKVSGAIDDALGMLGTIGKFEGSYDVMPAIERIVDVIQQTVEALSSVAAVVAEDMQEAARTLAENAEPVIKIIGGVLAFVGKLSELLQSRPVITNSATLPQPLVFLRDVLRRMGELMQALVSDPVLAEVDEWTVLLAGRLGSLIGPFEKVLGFVGKLSTLVQGGPVITNSESLPQPLIFLKNVLRRMGEMMTWLMADPLLVNIDEDLVAFSGKLAEVVGPFEKVLGFIGKLSTLVQGGPVITNSESLPQPLIFLKNVLRRMGELMTWLMADPLLAGLDDELAGFAGRLGEMAGPFGDVLEFVADLSELVQGGPVITNSESLPQPLIFLQDVLGRMAELLSELANDPRVAGLDDELVAFARRLEGITGVWDGAIGAVEALADFETLPDIAVVDAGLEQLRAFLVRLVVQLSVAGQMVSVTLQEAARKFADNAGPVAGLISSGINALTDLGAWKAAPDLESKMTLFTTTWTMVIETLARISKETRDLADEELRRFASAAGDIGAGLQRAIGFLVDLGAWKKAENLEELVDELVRITVYTLGQLAEAIGDWRTEGLELATAFGQAVGSVMGGLQAAFELAALAPGSWSVDAGLWAGFFAWVAQVFELAYEWVNRQGTVAGVPAPIYTEPGLGLVGAWAQALGSVMGGLQAAANFVLRADWAAPADDLWWAFYSWVNQVFDLVYEWVTTLHQSPYGGGVFTEDGLAVVTAWGGALGSVMQGLQAAANFVLSPTWTAPADDLWWSFYSWVNQVFDLVYEWVTTLHQSPYGGGVFTEGGLAVVNAWGSALGSVMQGLQAAASFVLSATWTAPSYELWTRFYGWVVSIFDLVYQWVTANVTADGLGVVSAFGSALSSVMGGLAAAADLTLTGWTAPATPSWEAFQAWVLGRMDDLYQWVVTTFPDSVAAAANFGVVSALGSAMSAVFGGLQAALDLSQGFWFSEPNTGLWTAFQDWVLGVFMDLHDWVLANFPTSPADATATFAPVMAFSQALDAVTGGLSGALDLLRNVMDTDTGSYQQSEGFTLFQDRVGWLMEGIDTVLEAFLTWVVSGETGWLDTAAAFAGAVGAVFDVLSQALGVFGTLTDEDIPSLDQINAFIEAVLNLFGSFAGGLLSAGGEVGTAVAGLGTTVAGLPGYLPDAATVQFWGYDLAYQLGYGLLNNDLGGDVSAMEAQLRGWLADAFGASDYGSLRWEMGQMGAELGWALASGIAAGIDPMGWSGQLYDWMNQAVEALVAYVIAQLNSTLGIASPSRVTFGIGQFIPAGLAEGIRAGIPAVGSAMGDLWAAVGGTAGGLDLRVQPSALAVTQGQRIEVVVSGDVSVGGERLSVAQREDIAQVIIQRLRSRG